MTRKPIVVLCEGSGCPTHDCRGARGVCSMCGERVVTDRHNRAHVHDRADVLAMLFRGDFDVPTERADTPASTAHNGRSEQ